MFQKRDYNLNIQYTMDIIEIAQKAKNASLQMAAISSDIKNRALQAMAKALTNNATAIFEANHADITRSQNENLDAPMLKRLKFDESKLQSVVDGIASLELLPDPVGRIQQATLLDDGLELRRVSCPIGVIGMIFESRPDALVQISSLCLKSGNAVLLKGGREAIETNRVLTKVIAEATIAAGIPEGWIQLLETREDVNAMLKLDQYIDLIIPRGSNAFVQYIMQNSSIAVLGHADGICHLYIDSAADIDMAVKVAVDAKCQYVSVCNATETMLVHSDVAKSFLPKLKAELDKYNVEIFGCERVAAIIPDVTPATDTTWKTEYLDYKVSIKVVDSIDEAIAHINRYSSRHTESIITSDANAAQRFMDLCDSGSVMWNCSTRFADGFRYGLGAEVGISTSKIHARGPVGLDGLQSYKWRLKGNGHIVADYANGTKTFKHKPLDK